MADNFSDKVIKKLQKQNLAVDLTEEKVVEPAAQEEVVAQSQDFQALVANSGTPGASANGKDIVVIPGGGTAANSTSQINFYWSKPTTQGSNNVDTNLRTTIFNFVENANPNEEPVLAIGGYNGTYYSPTADYGGVTGQTVAKVWIHPFSGTIDTSVLALDQVANTASIKFGTGTVTQTTTTKGHLGWTGTRLVIGDGSTANSIAYTSDISGAQNVYSSISDGTNSASAGNTTDTIKFRGSNGVTTTVGSNDPTWGDNLSISLSSVPNSALANSSVTIGSTTIALGGTATSISGLTAVTSNLFTGPLTASNVRIGNSSGTIDTSTGNLTIDSTGGTTTINDNLSVSGTTVTLSGASATVTLAGSSSTISANSNRIQNVTDPTGAQDAATKAYVDALKVGIDVHESVRCVITTAIAGNYVQSSAAGANNAIGATITYTAAGATTIDTNVTLAQNERVLVVGGVSGTITANGVGITNTVGDPNKYAANGIYFVETAGTTGVATVLKRATDTDDNVELEGGTFTFVQEGATYADSGWVCTNNTQTTPIVFAPSSGTVGTIQFTQFTGAGQITATAPLVKNNNTLSLSLKANGGLVTESNALAVDLGASSITGTLAVGDGGTGQTTLQSNGVLFGNGTSGILATAQGTAGQLIIANTSNVPTFTTIGGDAASLSGTGALTLANTTVTSGSYGSTTSVATFTVDSKGRLTAAGNAAIPTATSSVLGLASFGSAFTVTAGNVVLNTVTVGNGGTGVTSFTGNGVLYGGSTLQSTAAGTDGQILVGVTSGAPIFRTVSGDAQISNLGVLTLNTTAVTSGSYGSATSVATFTVDSKGRLTAASNTNINISSSAGSQSANTFFAAPNGSASTPSFRAIVLADLPTISIAKGGTNTTSQTNGGITYFDNTSIVSGSALTWVPGNQTGAGSSSSHYINATSLTSGTAVTINVPTGGATGKIIVGQLNNVDKFSVDANGNLRATTKSFDIPHPTKEGKRLVYGVLEGPEHGVYHRGTVEGKDKIKVELPEYWHKLVGEDYSVQLTSWGAYAVHLVEKTENYFIIQLSSNIVMRKLKTIKVDYVVHGARLDAPLEIEQ